MTDRLTLAEERDSLRAADGPWTAHNLRLSEGVFTIADRLTYDTVKLRRVVQAVSDLAGGNLGGLRVLDLGILEGLYALEFGLQGVKEAVGIEAREANLRKSEFARKALSLDNVRFHLDDARAISEEKYGRFDVVLCLGLLYHLDSPAVFEVLERMESMCNRILVIDTHIAPEAFDSVSYKRDTYQGSFEPEFSKGTSAQDKIKLVWRALDNDKSFLLTHKSLLRFLSSRGFTSIFECHVPFEYVKPRDRVTLVALKGPKAAIKSYPEINGLAEDAVKRAMLTEGGTFLVRENVLLAAARKASRAVRNLVRRAGARTGTES